MPRDTLAALASISVESIVIPPAPDAFIPTPDVFKVDEPFNPKSHYVSQEKAMEVVSELDQRRFNKMGTIEQHSGVHHQYGPCIVLITATSDSVIIEMS